MRDIDASTQVCAVIGNPVGHSLSPRMHNAAFESTGLNYVYVAFEVVDVGACLAGMRALGNFRGMSVTIPHKGAVIPFLDEVDPLASEIGSVNTITKEDGRLFGSSTDGPGTLRAFEAAGVDLTGKRVLFLGSGGAVRSVAFAMAMQGTVGAMTILGRTPERVRALAQDVTSKTGLPVVSGDLEEEVRAAVESHDVLIQGTPVGMYPESVGDSCVPREALRPETVVFDMVYRPLKTRLLADAEAAGCRVVTGLEMLIHQAVLQFEGWTGVPAPAAVMRSALTRALTEPSRAAPSPTGRGEA